MADLDKLERLARLRDSGALSPAEYDAEKARVLAGEDRNQLPLFVGLGIAAVLIVAGLVWMLTRQTGDDIHNVVAAAGPAPEHPFAVPDQYASPTPAVSPIFVPPTAPIVSSAAPTPSPTKASAKTVDAQPSGIPAPNPSNADYYAEARARATRQYGDQPPAIRAMLSDYAGANELCRGSSDEATINKWCPIRDRMGKKLESNGLCYGRPGQSGAEMDWHACDDQGSQ